MWKSQVIHFHRSSLLITKKYAKMLIAYFMKMHIKCVLIVIIKEKDHEIVILFVVIFAIFLA